jgi:transposase InsO family protein
VHADCGAAAGASKANARWCGDVTYISTWEGGLYLATVIDIAFRRVAGYAIADQPPRPPSDRR